MSNALHISYSWKGESEAFIQRLLPKLDNKNIKYIIDKNDLKEKGLITSFMKEIGLANNILVVIDDKYVKSEYCMYELYEIFVSCRNRVDTFLNKIQLVVLDDAKIYNATGINHYVSFWKDFLDKIQNTNIISSKYLKIYAHLEEILSILGDELNVRYHSSEEFVDQLCNKLDLWLAKRLEYPIQNVMDIVSKGNLRSSYIELNELKSHYPQCPNISIGLTTLLLRGNIVQTNRSVVDDLFESLVLGLEDEKRTDYKTIFCLLSILKIDYYEYLNILLPKNYFLQYNSYIEGSEFRKELLIGMRLSKKALLKVREIHRL